MDKTKVKRRVRREHIKQVNIKVPLSVLDFVKTNQYSLTAILMEGLKELGWTSKPVEHKPDAFVNVYTAKGDVSTETNKTSKKHTRKARR